VGGTRVNGVPTPFSRFALKCVGSCFEIAIFWMRSHTFFVSTPSLIGVVPSIALINTERYYVNKLIENDIHSVIDAFAKRKHRHRYFF